MEYSFTRKGWVARERDNTLYVHQIRPKRYNEDGIQYWDGGYKFFLPYTAFPDVKWESDPIEVEITIKRKED